MDKWVYQFGDGRAEGAADMRGKGANLAEMSSLGLPVPPGFTVTTEVCSHYYKNDKSFPESLKQQIADALDAIAELTGRQFGDDDNPLLMSVRSGARSSMPGMMDTVLNLGLNDNSVETIARHSGDARFAYDSYRRFIQMYGDVVMGLDHHAFEEILENFKNRAGYVLDTDLTADDWKQIVSDYKDLVGRELETPFPQDPKDQLWGGIGAVFQSWMAPSF